MKTIGELSSYSKFESNDKITTVNADEAFREVDGLGQGEVVVAQSLEDILNFDRDFAESIIPNWRECSPISLSESIENMFGRINEQDEDRFFDLLKQVRELDEVREILYRIKDIGPNNERQRTIAEIYNRFSSQNPEHHLETEDINIAMLLDFVSYFKSEFEKTVKDMGVKGMVIQSRNSLLSRLESGKDIPLIKKADRLRIAEDIKRVPIIIEDSLTAEVQRDRSTNDWLGYFLPDKRVCYVDPLAIASSFQDLFDERLSQVIYHELFHAATLDVYELREFKEEETEVPSVKPFISRKEPVWPPFLFEAMVEKFAVYCIAPNVDVDKIYQSSAVKQQDKALNMIFGNLHPISREEHWRLKKNADSPVRHMLVNKKHALVSEIIPKSYYRYRYLLDIMMHKIDWESVGITSGQAEKLLIDGFLERPENEIKSDKRWPKRKRLMATINEATNPGFFNRLTRVVEQIGIDEAITILSSPDFNPRDPNAIPILMSSNQYKYLSRHGKQQALDFRRAYLQILRGQNASQHDIDRAEKRVELAIKSSVALHNYQQVLRGLRAKLGGGEKTEDDIVDILVYEKWQRDRRNNT